MLYDIANEIEKDYTIDILTDAKLTAYKDEREIFIHYDEEYGDWNLIVSSGGWQIFHLSGSLEEVHEAVEEIL
jgi:hypothetical protein